MNNRNPLLLLGALAGAITPALADSVNVQTFTPSSGSGYVFNENARPEVPANIAGDASYRRYTLGLNYNYLDSPLVELDSSHSNRLDTLVNGIQTIDLQAGIEWNGRISFNLGLPLNMVSIGGGADRFAAGDLRIFPKIYLSDRKSPVGFALVPELRLPTGDPGLYTSNDGPSYGLLLAIEHDFGPLAVAANAGYRGSPTAIFREVDYRQLMPLAVGLNIPFAPRWAFNVEGTVSVVLPFNRYQNPSDLYGGLNWHVTDELVATGGAAVDTFNSAGSGNFRVAIGLRFSPISVDQAPVPIIKDTIPMAAAAPETRVVYTPKWIYVRDEILFEHNSDKLIQPSKELLDEVASVLKANRGDYSAVTIEGHCNELGSDEYNLALSQKRAVAVKKYLTSKGIEPGALNPIGYGKRRPKVTKASGVTKETRLVMNRRVQFKVEHAPRKEKP